MIPITLGYAMDLIFGDPRWLPHPVKIIGRAITTFESILRKSILGDRLCGIILAVTVISLSWIAPLFLIQAAASINKYMAGILSAVFVYTALSIKDLKVHATAIYAALKNKNLPQAREKLSMVVGRDTQNLSDEEIIRAAVETIAENTVDGIISPLFFAFLGGAPMAMAYKAINTLDSMVGYKNARYKDFGWASAKIDDIANFIPARISVLLIPIAAQIIRMTGNKSLKIALRDGGKNPSPNSGIPQAAIAGALGIQLGGECSYAGEAVPKPLIGDSVNSLSIEHISASVKISYICGILALLFGNIIVWVTKI